MKICLIKQEDNSFRPAYHSDLDQVQKIKPGKPILVELKQPRNALHHKLVFALAKCTLDNMSGPWSEMYQRDPNKTPYLFIKAIMQEIGQVDIVPNLDGTARTEVLSISFENMSEKEFEPVSDAIFEICARELKITVQELRRNYERYL